MKKLMFVAAVALCATVPCAALESANTVGYAGSTLANNAFKATGAQFAGVSATMDIQDLKVIGYSDVFEGSVNIQFLNANGRTTAIYYWVDLPADPDDPDSEAFYGWYDGNDILAENVPVIPGAGLWMQSDSSAYSLQSAGQVITTDTATTLRANGFIMVANPTPVDVDLQDLSVTGYSDVFEGSLNVQFLNGNGRTTAIYYWVDLPADPDDPDSEAFYGWYDGNDVLAENVSVQAGTALWTQSDSASYALVFPGVTL